MSARPLGQITRGTTGPNRLRRIDRWLINSECSRLRAAQAPVVVDLGFGASPITAFELRQRLAREVRSDIRVVGVEIDPERVSAAAPLADETLSFARGGFDLVPGLTPDVVRAANVLRQYDEPEVWPAWREVTSRLQPGGLLIDATCDEIGRLGSWIGVRAGERGEPVPETFTISVSVLHLERPSAVAARLPKSLIHHNTAGERVHEFLRALDEGWERTAGHSVFGPRAHWVAMCEYATAHGLSTLDHKTRWRLGELTVAWAVVAP